MIRFGILGGADIAYKSFLPALMGLKDKVSCTVLGSRSPERHDRFIRDFGLHVVSTYEEILSDPDIDAVYIPLPPALHYAWAKIALESGKHVFLEKPSTTDYAETSDLVAMADRFGLVLQENYMFQYHSQIVEIGNLLNSGRIGNARLYRGNFGFPARSPHDFRYSKVLGGGALMDAGGYVIKLATLFLGVSVKIDAAISQMDDSRDVDIFGSVTMSNNDHIIFQGAYGMDCAYQCALEIWGTSGRLTTNRIFTAPAGYIPTITVEDSSGIEVIELEPDIHFKKSIEAFCAAVSSEKLRNEFSSNLLLQSRLVTEMKEMMRL